MKTKIILFTTILIIISSVKVFGEDNKPISIYINNEKLIFGELKPYINNDSKIMVPARHVLEYMDYEVKWDNKLKSVIANEKIISNNDGLVINGSYYISLHCLVKDLNHYIYYNESNNCVEIDTSHIYKKNSFEYKKPIIMKEDYIAHGGGMIEGLITTNSLEAIEKSVDNGVKMIEIDFRFTTDGIPVLIHNWGFAKIFFGMESRPYSYKEFMKDFVMYCGLHHLDIEGAMNYLREHEEIYYITDTKDDNIALLKYISNQYPDLKHRIIPQIYYKEQYDPVRTMGYDNIILTLYKMNNSNKEITTIIKSIELFAVTMPIERVYSGLAKEIEKYNITTYAHTVNNYDEYLELKELGIDGVYTDSLYLGEANE